MLYKVLLWAFAYVLISCQGLEITLDRKSLGSSDRRATCGVLLCMEQSHTSVNGNVTLVDDDSEPITPSGQVAKISSMKIFRVKSISSDTKRRSLLASISPQHNRLSRVSNGMNMEGRIDKPGRASLKIKFTKETDCQAEFVCQVHGVDTEGRQVVRTSYLKQLQLIKDNQDGNSNRDSGLAMQVLAIVQELNAKLAVVGNTIGNLEQEMNRLRETVQLDMESLKNDFNSKSSRLEDKSDASYKRLEDKVENLDKNLDAKTDRLEDKIESVKDRLQDSFKSVAKTTNREETSELSSCHNNVSDAFGGQIRSGMLNLEEKVLAIKDELAEIGTAIGNSVDENFVKIQQQLQAGVKSNETTVEEYVSRPSSEPSCEKIKDLSDEVGEGFASLSNSLQDKYSDLASKIKASATDVQRVVSGQTSLDTLTSGTDRQYTLVKLLTPKTCYKGMSAYVPSVSNKYTVINPSPENNLNNPVLCDMRTDGGGWVVFQRRVLGDVDFYKGWDAYKHGFGSLHGDFWLGNDLIHNLTKSGKAELRIDMKYKDNYAFAHYGGFSVAGEEKKYAIKVSNFGGTAGDSLTTPHNGQPFTTHDRDNDAWAKNCAVVYTGAWWHKACHHSNLNGVWAVGGNKGPRWSTFSSTNSVSFSEMKVRIVQGKTV